ncbi:hypothetical protein L596_001717 [Steinernema carpocapsae]|uniref:Uncharacterized protein n=1 Tax=Steinernema carpocapsae TaxID=34508 RepID=A0A4U8UMB0_STECR|nr:hypothetical protein L596_001717 [Steinernema carpocapsae]
MFRMAKNTLPSSHRGGPDFPPKFPLSAGWNSRSGSKLKRNDLAQKYFPVRSREFKSEDSTRLGISN